MGASHKAGDYEAGETLAATDQADIFRFDNIDQDTSTIQNFDASEDALDISGMIEGFDPVQDAIDDYVIQTQSEQGLEISVDADGAGGKAISQQIVVLQGQDQQLDLSNILVE
mgnify:CR=1 FL=1